MSLKDDVYNFVIFLLELVLEEMPEIDEYGISLTWSVQSELERDRRYKVLYTKLLRYD